ncbi:hypothetical protein BEL04_06925 [Mucilaginibacter sp. PPCGB 2223]|uniref:YciE/YciF ferroxidase family protein n=1 Tax=Mucilaginibacter sp. PPCGB 2223 TaxID=1886027 RepID=UPI0008259AB2|nr:DUF892 family protein [Mucilaginibacter sp. PPCGB 2223]OCX54002.1 hypothetical protein BEL04_06925 [Mucilaginibacter sp. PPCGB 2223]
METNSTITILRQLLDDDIRRLISAEAELANSLVVWSKKAGALPLKMLLQEYNQQTESHIEKLNAYAAAEQINAISIANRVMKAYIDETDDKLAACSLSDVRDASLLASVQSICHFKISMYGTAATFANLLDLKEAAKVFHEAESNEKGMDERLSFLAEDHINKKAKSPVALPL